MKLATYARDAAEAWRPALVEGERVLDLADLLAAAGASLETGDAVPASPLDPVFWLQPQGQRLAARLAQEAPAAHVRALSQVRLGPPMPRPGKFIAVGRNYMSHVKEGQQVWAARGREVKLPTFPAAFTKYSSAITGPDSEIPIPEGISTVDYEIELALVIGRPAFRVREEEALDHVAGYTVCNDIGARELQMPEMESQIGITLSKNFPGFAPIGPWFVTADEIPDPQALTLDLRVNGGPRQHASTSDMIFSVRRIIAYWSQIGLQPGDMITTGTPPGVALAMPEPHKHYLKAGDRVEAEISGIGRLVNHMGGAKAGVAA